MRQTFPDKIVSEIQVALLGSFLLDQFLVATKTYQIIHRMVDAPRVVQSQFPFPVLPNLQLKITCLANCKKILSFAELLQNVQRA